MILFVCTLVELVGALGATLGRCTTRCLTFASISGATAATTENAGLLCLNLSAHGVDFSLVLVKVDAI